MSRIKRTTLAQIMAIIAVLTTWTFAEASTASAAEALIAPQSPLPVALWRACPVGDRAAAEYQVVRTFERSPGHAIGRTMPGGSSDLVCGRNEHGYYHIVNRHGLEWSQKGYITSENWRFVADYSFQETLRTPESVTYDPDRDTFCYSRNIYLVNKVTGAIVTSFHPNVVISGSSGRIVTAWPSNAPC